MKGSGTLRDPETAKRTARPLRPPRDPRSEEALRVIRRAVEKLPRLERLVVALHYAARISKGDIGGELSMPRHAVCTALNRALERLRADLSLAGPVADGVDPDPETLSRAICSGHKVPAGLYRRVMIRIFGGDVNNSKSRSMDEPGRRPACQR
jgi:hypothetical protein